jgi:acetyltransferase-like isoleucine patch superfamily enzyme
MSVFPQKSSLNAVPRSTLPIVLIEIGLVLFTILATILIHHAYPLDAFKIVIVSLTVFSIGTLIVLKVILARSPLLPGTYTAKDHPHVLRAWQIFNFLAMNNLFFYYQNALLPPIVRKFFSRMLGAKIGSGLISIAGPIFDPYLITLGKNSMLGQDTILQPSIYDGHRLVLGSIRVGEGSIIGARSVVMSNVEIGKNALVKAMSLVTEGTRIGDYEIWGGIPARKMGDSPIQDAPARFSDTAYMILCGSVQTVILGTAGILSWISARQWNWDLFVTLVAFYFFQIIMAFFVLTVTRMMYPFKEGIYSFRTDKWVCYRWNLFAFIGITNLFLHYQRDFLPPALRSFFTWLMGARLRLRKNFLSSGGIVFDPFFVEVEEGATIGYEVLLLPHAIAVDQLHLKRIKIGDGATLGDRTLVMPGAEIGKNAVIRPLSLVTSNTKVPDGEVWGGVPARKKGDVISKISTSLRRQRGIDVLVTVLTESLILGGSIISVCKINNAYPLSPFMNLVLFYFFWVLLTMVVAAIIRLLYKFPEGEFTQQEHPALFLFWKLHAFLCVTNLFVHYQNAFLPPATRKIFLALLGARIDFRGILNMASAVVADPYFVTLGRSSLLGHESLILTLNLNGEKLTLRRVKIGEGAVIGERAVVLPGVTIGDHAEILPLSLVEENTVVPAGEIWGGIPARKVGECCK